MDVRPSTGYWSVRLRPAILSYDCGQPKPFGAPWRSAHHPHKTPVRNLLRSGFETPIRNHRGRG